MDLSVLYFKDVGITPTPAEERMLVPGREMKSAGCGILFMTIITGINAHGSNEENVRQNQLLHFFEFCEDFKNEAALTRVMNTVAMKVSQLWRKACTAVFSSWYFRGCISELVFQSISD